jgi:tRNA(His) guanylyltransferase
MRSDALGDRIKWQYEDRTRYSLPRRTYTILRLDGCHFHTYTKGLTRPFDGDLSEDIDNAILAMLPQLQGAQFAYTQSDEISILLTDFNKNTTDAWFDGNIQKINSVAASILTAEFNRNRFARWIWDKNDKAMTMVTKGEDDKWNFICQCPTAYFDCRAFTIPDPTEVMNYFRWRQQDCIRNSISSVSQFHYSHKELHGKSQSDMHEMLHTKGVNWATDFTDGEKNGRFIHKEEQEREGIFFVKNRAEGQTLPCNRKHWVANGAWVFTKDEGRLATYIPKYE